MPPSGAPRLFHNPQVFEPKCCCFQFKTEQNPQCPICAGLFVGKCFPKQRATCLPKWRLFGLCVVCKTKCLFAKYRPELLMQTCSQQTAISGSRASLEALPKTVSTPKADVLSSECSKAGAGINRNPDFYQACQEDKQPFKSRISHFTNFWSLAVFALCSVEKFYNLLKVCSQLINNLIQLWWTERDRGHHKRAKFQRPDCLWGTILIASAPFQSSVRFGYRSALTLQHNDFSASK